MSKSLMPTDEQKQERERQADRIAKMSEARAFERGLTAGAALLSGNYPEFERHRDWWESSQRQA